MTAGNDFAGARWRKSSRSASSGACVELAWHMSSQYVELAHAEGVFGVRDSKYADGPVLALAARHGLAFIGAVRSGRIARP
ncbi:DUF397 domain-containing protein [Actinophytocola sp.]|uniref:DUF397 domain-containing protein n=1 Tax=Actinophytocola sp. TaxID=1872138 RepID=UPI002D7EC795|nr:DUF397 domain-containing protein [Actinophytocola sp.]HET9138578.1 DUF397 domain-containing protein [Actinophytocola sp.]